MPREDHFQALFDGSLDAIGIVDDEGRFVDVNPAACRLYEMTREQLLQQRLDFFGGADPESFRSDWSEFLRRGTLEGERVITVGGRQKTVAISATAHFSPGRHLGILRDITERRRADAALEARERRFRHLVEHGSDVIVLTGPDPRIRYASPSAERALGRTVDSLIGTDALSLVHPEDQEAARVQATRCVSDPQGSVTGQVRLRRGDGTWGHFEFVTFNRLGDPDVQAVVTNLRDITERRTAHATPASRTPRSSTSTRGSSVSPAMPRRR
jgi:PAS domain S-box-containing protein